MVPVGCYLTPRSLSQIKCERGEEIAANGHHVNCLEVELVHDNWRYFMVDGYILQYNIFLGTGPSQHLLVTTPHGLHEKHVEFKLCNMLQVPLHCLV